MVISSNKGSNHCFEKTQAGIAESPQILYTNFVHPDMLRLLFHELDALLLPYHRLTYLTYYSKLNYSIREWSSQGTLLHMEVVERRGMH